jgi:hypothetical protein
MQHVRCCGSDVLSSLRMTKAVPAGKRKQYVVATALMHQWTGWKGPVQKLLWAHQPRSEGTSPG